MDSSEKIAYNYLKQLYPISEIKFEPNGDTTFPDFQCGSQEFEVSSLYQKLDHRCVEEHEAPILKMVQALIEQYNCKDGEGYYFFLTISGAEKLEKEQKKHLEKWFRNNDKKVKSLAFKNKTLSIRLQSQKKYKEKYVSAGIVNHNRGGYVFDEYKKALLHIIEKKMIKNQSHAILLLIDIDMNPIIDNNIRDLDFSNIPFQIIVLNQESKVKYSWN
ncbi:MAG: hypothetical protein KJ017_13185 [Alphaproteobacteria bacterium]|nr:hypothetical protein [Alphaproteobacteria bacterium]